MSWLNLNQSLNSLKGQITNFATEVLNDGGAESTVEEPSRTEEVKNLEEKCRNHELEIAALKKLTDELQASLKSERLARKNGVKEEESSWYWDPTPSKPADDEVDQYKMRIQDLQARLSALKDMEAEKNFKNVNVMKLQDENRQLTASLEVLDSQHQMAMDKILALKKELQKNFEVLKLEHQELKNANNEYAIEINMLMQRLEEKDKEIESTKASHMEYATLQHKYQNLERVHSLLRDNAEKFQEENQELHEEVFKLQERVTKLEHDLEVSNKQNDGTNMVPKEKYDDVMEELDNFKRRRNSNQMHLDEVNIDDNAKSVIETLKQNINTLKHRLDSNEGDSPSIKTDKIVQLYNNYVTFDMPLDNDGEMSASNVSVVLSKLETTFKMASSYRDELYNCQQLISENILKNKYLQSKIDELTSENEYLASEVQHLEGDLEEMKKNNDFLISEIAVLKNSSKLEPIIETHEDNLAKLETELADCNKINKTFESTIDRIENELAIVKCEKNILQESLNDMRNKYKRMLSQLEMCENNSIALQELESHAKIVKETNHSEISNELDELKGRLTAANLEKEKIAIDVNVLINDKVLLEKETSELRNALEASLNYQREIESMKIKLSEKLQKLKTKLLTILKEKEHLGTDNAKLKGSLQALESSMLNSTDIAKTTDEIENELKVIYEGNSRLIEKSSLLLEELEGLKMEKERRCSANKLIKERLLKAIEKCPRFDEVSNNLELKSDQLDMLEKEISLRKVENENIMKLKNHFEEQLTSKNNVILEMENESKKITMEINNKASEINKLNTAVLNLEDKVKNKEFEIAKLQKEIIKRTEDLQAYSDSFNARDELNKVYVDNEEIRKRSQTLIEEISAKNHEISQLNHEIQNNQINCTKYKIVIESKDKEIKELMEHISEMSNKLSHENTSQSNDDYIKLKEEKVSLDITLNSLRLELQTKENDLIESKNRLEVLENACKEHKQMLHNATTEKAELINLINLKHNESIQYHNEIQRLNNVLLNQENELKRIIEEKELLSKKNVKKCTNCDILSISLKEKDEIIIALNENVTQYETLKSKLNSGNETVQNLTRKSEELDKNLTVQMDIVKRLTAENSQLSEKEQNSSRELERLRHHLVEMEDHYTQELMASEQKFNESQTRLQQVEERAKQNSTVYTSNSIRANQEVETLRNQIKLLEKQRDDVQTKLSDAEDTRSRSEAALTNLQIVLEQFQMDKEREIEAATEKIKKNLEEEKQFSLSLRKEITKLNTKLEESKAGLQAATRLGDQVETKSAQINDLKEQVRTLQISVAAAEERYHNAISNQQDKVDKNLVKNLVVNYVVSGRNNLNRTQVLRVLSTVLDFNQQECEKLGLIKPTGGESLAAEFVKFLQDESKPRPSTVAPALVRLQTDLSRKMSTSSQNPIELGQHTTHHSRNPSTGSNNLLFTSTETSSQRSTESEPKVLPVNILETGINQTRNNEGAILKNVLKDLN